MGLQIIYWLPYDRDVTFRPWLSGNSLDLANEYQQAIITNDFKFKTCLERGLFMVKFQLI